MNISFNNCGISKEFFDYYGLENWTGEVKSFELDLGGNLLSEACLNAVKKSLLNRPHLTTLKLHLAESGIEGKLGNLCTYFIEMKYIKELYIDLQSNNI